MADGRIETAWEFLKAFEGIGPGGFTHLALASGMEFVFLDIQSLTGMESVIDIGEAPLGFSFHLSGCGQGTLIRSARVKEQVAVGPGKAVLSFNPGIRCHTRMADGQAFRVLNIYIHPERLYRLLEGDLTQIPRPLAPVLTTPEPPPLNLSCEITPHIRMLVDQIYNCPFDGIFRRLYLEAKGMEAVLRLLWEMSRANPPGRSPSLSGRDREQISLARDILIQMVDTPPSLKTLAKKAGLNDTKLKRGFRQMFGTTVFGYLRQYRMEKSMDLLASGGMNVDETAHYLGFHDTAHFIRQFKQHYGTTPGAYLRQVRSPPPSA